MVDFQKALQTKGNEIEKPPVQPIGSYRMYVVKPPEFSEISSDKGDWDVINITMGTREALGDVDEDDLKAFGDVTKAPRQRLSFMFDKNDEAAFDRTMYQMKRFLGEHLEVDGVEEQALQKSLAECINHECICYIDWTPNKNDPEEYYANIKRTAPVSATD